MNSPTPGFDRPAPVSVRRAAPHEWGDALALLVQGAPESERPARVLDALEAVAVERLSLAGLLVAESNGRLVGATLSVRQPDDIAFVWLPASRGALPESEASDVARSLWHALERELDAQGLVCAQCLLEPGDLVDRRLLVQHGFQHAADLETMDRLLSEPFPERRAFAGRVVPYDPPHNVERFASLIEQTYLDSADCPAFTARRSGVDALRSHQTAGEFDPARWVLFEVDGSDAGVLLLSLHPEAQACELVYMGVAPAHRGRGLGRHMLVEGLHAARGWGCETMFLAVDAANRYAIDVYASLGFVPRGLREAWVRWPGGENPQREHSPRGA